MVEIVAIILHAKEKIYEILLMLNSIEFGFLEKDNFIGIFLFIAF